MQHDISVKLILTTGSIKDLRNLYCIFNATNYFSK